MFNGRGMGASEWIKTCEILGIPKNYEAFRQTRPAYMTMGHAMVTQEVVVLPPN